MSLNCRFVLVFTVFGMFLSACGSDKENKPAEPTIKKVYMGNPENIYKNTSLDPIIDEQLLEDGLILGLTGAYNFDSFAMYDESQAEVSAEVGNEATEEYEENDAYQFKVLKFGKKTLLRGSFGSEEVSIEFTNTFDSIGQIVNLNSSSGSEKGHLLHFSNSKDKNHFSFLFRQQDADNISVFVLYFTKQTKVGQPKMADKAYKYIRGAGVKVRWNPSEDINIEIASDMTSPLKNDIALAAEVWDREIESLNINVKEISPAKVKPFSDLQQFGIYLIDDFLFEPANKYATYGAAISREDSLNFHFFDSDILLFKKEFAKSGYDMFHRYQKRHRWITVLHEMGHTLGLDHMFDGIKSIMSYSFDSTDLTNYDKAAIKELYKD